MGGIIRKIKRKIMEATRKPDVICVRVDERWR